MTPRKFLVLGAAGIVLCAIAAYFLLVPRRADFAGLRKGRDFNVIVISLDTARADRLGCYGCRDIETPTYDAFAASGVRFDACYAQTPMTLPSHTTLFTGTLPLFHGVRDNGGFIVPQKLVTMAELFKDKGYETGAFIGAWVLDSRWGLNQGFDTYFDKFDLRKFKRVSLDTVQRPANEVMDEALPWLEKRKDKKFFTWIHLYDPHSPYEPPPPYDTRYAAQPYLGEIAFTDAQVRRLWEFLGNNGLLEKTFIVFAGDHGESLGEHGEKTHGFFIYQGAIRVPLIIVTPFPKLHGVVSSEVAGLVDVLPTVCEMAGLAVPADVQGRSLVPAFFGRRKAESPLAYAETYYPRFHFGWSELKSVQDGRYKLILAPVPELYDVGADPGEEKNLLDLHKDIYEKLNTRAEALIETAGRNAYEMDTSKVDAETRERLSALGYVGSFTDPARLKGRTLANPKEKIGVFNELTRAREMGMTGRPDEAVRIVQGIIANDPDITDAYFLIGDICLQQKKFEEALTYFRQVLERKPDETFAAINMTTAYEQMGKFEEAERFVLEYQKKGFEEPQLYFLLGNMNFSRKQYDRAIPWFEKTISLNHNAAEARNTLATIYIARNDLARAEDNLRRALESDPRRSNIHYRIGWIAEKQGRLEEAEGEYAKELEITPRHFQALYNLARIYDTTGKLEKEEDALKRCLEAAPEFPLTYFYLARLYLRRGERYTEAVGLVEKGIGLRPEPSQLVSGYFLLSDLYKRLGDEGRSGDYARKAQALGASLERSR